MSIARIADQGQAKLMGRFVTMVHALPEGDDRMRSESLTTSDQPGQISPSTLNHPGPERNSHMRITRYNTSGR